MKNLKTFGLATLVVMALTAFIGVGVASASSVICSTASNPCSSKWAVGTVLSFSLEAGTSTQFVSTGGQTLMTCTETRLKGKLTANPNASGEATGEGIEITPSGCTYPVTPLTLGKIRGNATDDSGDGDLITDSEFEWTLSIPSFVGGPCIYQVTAGTRLGTWNEPKQTFTANAIANRTQTATHPCVFGTATALFSGTYVKTEPSNTTLYVSTS